MDEYLSVSSAAREINANPRHVSDLLYQGHLRGDLCPLVAGRRIIPRSYLPQIVAALRRRGLLRQEVVSA